MRLDKIAGNLNGELFGPPDIEISGPAKIDDAKKSEITFLANKKYSPSVKTTQAGAIILDEKIEGLTIPYILVPNAYVGFLMLLKLFQPEMHKYIKGISDQAFIDESAEIAESAAVGPHVYAGPGVKIGKNTIIYPGAVILKDVVIGDDCVIYPNVSIREDCVIGNRVILQNGCVIGSDGFGFAPQKDTYIKIPQIGRVIIEDDVELGANTTIDRATLGETLLRQGCKLDNLVQIAHNVIIGKDTVIASQSGVSGSTEIGGHVTIAGQVGIVGHIKINNNAVIAAQSGISKDVSENEIMWGTPAKPISVQKKIEISSRQLPELLKRVKSLEKEIENLKKQQAR